MTFFIHCDIVTTWPTCPSCGETDTEEVRKVSEHVFEELGSRCCFGGGHHRSAFVVDSDMEVFRIVNACDILV